MHEGRWFHSTRRLLYLAEIEMLHTVDMANDTFITPVGEESEAIVREFRAEDRVLIVCGGVFPPHALASTSHG